MNIREIEARLDRLVESGPAFHAREIDRLILQRDRKRRSAKAGSFMEQGKQVHEISQNAGWQPRPRQKAVLDAAKQPGVKRTITAICEEAGVTPRTFYNWLGQESGFRDAWNEIWVTSIDDHMPSVVAAQVGRALDGSTRAAEYLTTLGGKMIRKGGITRRGEAIGIDDEHVDRAMATLADAVREHIVIVGIDVSRL